jgi:hypothetical protein
MILDRADGWELKVPNIEAVKVRSGRVPTTSQLMQPIIA